jgi:peptidoglycan/xylan/chitin deacetylase (PgdA/CDA1 family)
VSPPNRAYGPFSTLQRRISSRLARHIPLGRSRLINVRPMVSFTFDDAAASAGVIGAEQLEKLGGRGTYYVASGLTGQEICDYALIDRPGVRDLHLRGHEIGLHGHAHRAAGSFSARDFRDDLQENRNWLEAIHDGIRPTNFAYPYGLVSFARKRQLYGLVNSSRSVAPGVNAGDFDPQFLRSVELADERLTPESLATYLDAAVGRNGWLIFCSHDIAEQPTRYGCTPALFERALHGAASRGIEIVTVADALKRSQVMGMRGRSTAEIAGSRR